MRVSEKERKEGNKKRKTVQVIQIYAEQRVK